jgi:hypothetical protein
MTAGLALVFFSANAFLPNFLKILENWRSWRAVVLLP